MSFDRRTTIPPGRPIIGIAFEGGGALGLAHVGVMQWMDEHHVPVDRISGTSMGALVGALIASGDSPEDIERLANSDVFNSLFALKPSLAHVSYRRREDRTEMPGALAFGMKKGNVTLGSGLTSDDQLNAFLTRELVSYSSSDLNYDDLPIPFRCVSTELTTLRPKVFDSGPLAFAVRSSISIPGVFRPVHLNDHILVDGAIVDNLPTDVLKQNLHADIIIAVHLEDAAIPVEAAAGLTSVFGRAFQAGTSRNEELSRTLANIEILPKVASFSATDYS
jgi:NTE family protein